MKTLIKATIATLVAAPFLVATAHAQATMADVDADGSGTVSFVEASTAIAGLTEDMFTAADADSDGELSVEEYDAMIASITQ